MKQISLSLVALLLVIGSAFAQNEGTYLEEESVKDSTYMEDLFMDEEEEVEADKSVDTQSASLYAVIGLAIVGGAIFVAKRKKK